MPRSGSTMLSNILGNHPDIYSTPTSPLFEILSSGKKIYTNSPVVKAQDSKQMKSAFLTYCRYAMEGYFDALTDKNIVIDKSRSWCVNKSFLEAFYPNPKIICIVRDLRDILASMEKNYRKHPEKWINEEDDIKLGIGERISLWMNPKSKPVGQTLYNLRETFHRGFQKDILFIRFEDLTTHPKEMMNAVHDYLKIKRYNYDFDNIKQVTFEDDKFHGIFGEHTIKNSVQPVKSESLDLLGENICNQIYENNKWYFETFKYEK